MKLTEQRLRRMVREEIEIMNEVSISPVVLKKIAGYLPKIFSVLHLYVIRYLLNDNSATIQSLKEPENIVKIWRILRKSRTIKDIISKLKNDDDIINFIKNPKSGGLRNLLSSKLEKNEKVVLTQTYKGLLKRL